MEKQQSSPSVVAIFGPLADFRARLEQWFLREGRDLPWRKTTDPYAILVSEFMCQQTQVATVLDYYRRWLALFPDFFALAAASETEVLHAWQGLGYYSRARNLHRAAQCVVEKFGGKLPSKLAAIAALPGVGRYTAGAVATFAFDQAVPIVDANIARVLARLCNYSEPIDSTRGGAFLWQAAADLQPVSSSKKDGGLTSASSLPPIGGRVFNSALMELGALVCIPRKPRCTQCPVRKNCHAVSPETLPRKRPRRATVELREDCAWIFREGKLLLAQQLGSRWRGLWKLPLLRDSAKNLRLLVATDYAFTHHRVKLSVFKIFAETSVDLEVRPPLQENEFPSKAREGHHWFTLHELEKVPLAAPHQRVIRRLLAEEKSGAPGPAEV